MELLYAPEAEMYAETLIKINFFRLQYYGIQTKKSYVILSSDSKMPLGFLRGNMRRYGRIHYKYREKEVGILRNEAI